MSFSPRFKAFCWGVLLVSQLFFMVVFILDDSWWSVMSGLAATVCVFALIEALEGR